MNVKIYEQLKSLKGILQNKYGIKKLALVGSQARDDFNSKSDVDLVIVEGKKDYFNRYKTIEFLSEKLNKKVDLVYYDSIRPIIKENIKKDLIYV